MRLARPSALLLAGCLLAASAWAADPLAVPAPVTPPAATVPEPGVVPTPPPALPAAPGRPVVQAPPYAPGPSAGSLLQTIFALCVVLGVLFALAWVMKRYGPKMQAGGAGLRVVGALNLGGRERIMVVEVGQQWIVVGASPGRVNALATMPKPDSVPGDATLAEHTPSASNFAEWLKQTIDKRNAK